MYCTIKNWYFFPLAHRLAYRTFKNKCLLKTYQGTLPIHVTSAVQLRRAGPHQASGRHQWAAPPPPAQSFPRILEQAGPAAARPGRWTSLRGRRNLLCGSWAAWRVPPVAEFRGQEPPPPPASQRQDTGVVYICHPVRAGKKCCGSETKVSDPACSLFRIRIRIRIRILI